MLPTISAVEGIARRKNAKRTLTSHNGNFMSQVRPEVNPRGICSREL